MTRTQGQHIFGHMVYLMAAVLDPNYGFVWLDADHSGDDSVKKSVRETVTNAILLEAELCCSMTLSDNDKESVSSTPEGTDQVESATPDGTTSEAPTPLKKAGPHFSPHTPCTVLRLQPKLHERTRAFGHW